MTLNNSKNKRGLHIKKMPFAFTEQGVYMLATVLKGELATKQSIEIIRVFKEMRHFIGGTIKDLGTKLTTIAKIEDCKKIYNEIKNNQEFTL